MWAGNFKTAFSYLRLYKWRSTLTMLGIIIGISSVVTIVSLGEGLKNQVVGQINQLGSDVLTIRSGTLGSQSSGSFNNLSLLTFSSPSSLTVKDVDSLKNLSSLNAVVPLDFLSDSLSANGSQDNNVSVLGTDTELLNLMHQKIEFGEFLDNNPDDQDTVVIGRDIAQQLFKETNAVGESLTISGQSFIVRGVLAQSPGSLLSVAETDFNSAAFIPFQAARDLVNSQTNITQILVRSKDPNNLSPAIGDIQRVLLANHNGQADFSVLKQDQLLGLVSGVVNTVTGFISGIAAISLLVGGIGIMDIMLVSISERTREIGVRKAIGATNGQILNQFLVEGLVLTIVGGFIGVILSLLINLVLRLYTNLHPAINIFIILLAVGVSVAVGLLFSVVPALKAARKDPIVALRGE